MSSIYDGFEAYRTPTAADVSKVLNSGIVVLDTNVLLDLYRYGARARGEFIAVLASLTGRLFVPHQVMREFWRNRISVLEEVGRSAITGELAAARSKVETALQAWGKRAQSEPLAETLIARFRSVFDSADRDLSAETGDLPIDDCLLDTGLDPIVQALERVLVGCVGVPFEADVTRNLVAEAEARFSVETPPGYLDGHKHGQSEQGAGDYLVWRQMIARRLAGSGPVLFVTRDIKPDWWRVDRLHRPLGPRTELVDEFRQETGDEFMMLEPRDLLFHASNVLGVSISPRTLNDAAQLAETGSFDGDDELEVPLSLPESLPSNVQAALVAALRSTSSGRPLYLSLIGKGTPGVNWTEFGFVNLKSVMAEVCRLNPQLALFQSSSGHPYVTLSMKSAGRRSPDSDPPGEHASAENPSTQSETQDPEPTEEL